MAKSRPKKEGRRSRERSEDVSLVTSLSSWKASKLHARESVADRIARKQQSKAGQSAFAVHKQRMDNYFSMASKILESKADKARQSEGLAKGPLLGKKFAGDAVDLTDQEVVLKNVVKAKLRFSPQSLEDTFENEDEMQRLLRESSAAANAVISGFKELKRKLVVSGPDNAQNKKLFNAIVRDWSSDSLPASLAGKSTSLVQESRLGVNWVDVFYKFQARLAKIDQKLHDQDREAPLEAEQAAPARCEVDLKIESVGGRHPAEGEDRQARKRLGRAAQHARAPDPARQAQREQLGHLGRHDQGGRL